jgi:hypothetical protein
MKGGGKISFESSDRHRKATQYTHVASSAWKHRTLVSENIWVFFHILLALYLFLLISTALSRSYGNTFLFVLLIFNEI